MGQFENDHVSNQDGSRRNKFTTGKKPGAVNTLNGQSAQKFHHDHQGSGGGGNQYITSPLNKSKQDVFSQTGKINLNSDGPIGMMDDTK